MENKEIIQKAAITEKFSFEMLLNDIQECVLGSEVAARLGDKAERERQSKLIVLQMLIMMAHEYNDDIHHEDEKLRNAIDVKINGDANLAGYIFFVSQNPQFDYSWNYLRKRESSYKEFLVEGIRFLDNALADINMMSGNPQIGKDIHIVMNDILDVSFVGHDPFVKCSVLWENFHRLAKVKREYNFTVKIKDCILTSGKRKSASDAENLFDTALAILNNIDGSTK